ncbi:MAG: hypothetical protein Q8922_03510 [Bacteroidota bacterium]|nr:hypothetical protein [Bacteroidota bacterium]MDP4233359.1 hypothetical protein [Bacteroidota bacterium]MDP4242225.1 hypothetical protein [Bacteroidota bacterium]MDP4286981.1 hypothetical protein [Bacteroidota bacterium]
MVSLIDLGIHIPVGLRRVLKIWHVATVFGFAGLLMLELSTAAFAQNVGIGTSTPDATALLDLTSTSQGLLVPRLTSAQMFAVPSPGTGDLIFNTSLTTFYFYDGLAWIPMTGTGWLLSGNGGTIAGTDFLGTTDNADLVFKANAMEGMRLSTSQNLGVGTATPASALHTVASGAMTTDYTGNLLTNVATSSTASITKYGMDILSSGTWNGASATNIGLHTNATGGTTNYSAIFEGGNAGINTTAPATYMDVSGDASIRYSSYSASNGVNNDINIGTSSFVRLTGPTADFSVTGVAGGVDGKVLILFNPTNQLFTISNENTGSVAADRIWTFNSTGDIVVDGKGAVKMIYSAPDSRWIVLSSTTVSTSSTGLIFAKKPADESVRSSTTLQNDNDLQLPISANDSMIVEGYIHYHNTGSGSLRMAFTIPTGASMDIAIYTDDVIQPPPETWTLTAGGASTGDMGMNGTDVPIHFYGMVISGANAGTIQIQWAQGVSSSTPTTFKAKSYIRGTLIR